MKIKLKPKKKPYTMTQSAKDARIRLWNIDRRIETMLLVEQGLSFEEIAVKQKRTKQAVEQQWYKIKKYSLDDLEKIRKEYFPE